MDSSMSEQETIWLAYGETAGYVQRASSKERAVREVKDGTLSKRQQLLLVFLDAAGTDGLTWKQLADITALHHGQVSGALSIMHKNNEIFALRIVRDRCHPYVHNAYKSIYAADERFDDAIRTVSSLRIELLMRLVDVCRDDINILNWREQKQRIDSLVSKIDSLGL